MPINELFPPLDYLDAARDILDLSLKLKNCYANPSEIYGIVSELEAKAGFSTGRFSDKSAYYRFLLAYTRLTNSNWIQAKRDAESAVRLFAQIGDKHNEAIARWFLALLLCVCEDRDEAEIKMQEAGTIISKLNEKSQVRGEYVIRDQKYGYADILKVMEATFSKTKKRLRDDLPRLKSKPTLDRKYFLEIISSLKFPAESNHLNKGRRAAFIQVDGPVANHSLLMEFEMILNQRKDEDEERLLIRILLAHHYNLDDYVRGQNGSRAMAFLEEAVDQYSSDDVNYLLCRSYLCLLCYNRDVEGNGQEHLESACLYLEKARQEYERQGDTDVANGLQYLQNMIRLCFRAVVMGPFEDHHFVPTFRKHPKPSDEPQTED